MSWKKIEQIPIRGGLRDDVKPMKTNIANALLARGISPQGFELTYVLIREENENQERNEKGFYRSE